MLFNLIAPQDAVAAGTVAAWTSLAANGIKTTSPLPPIIPEDSLASLTSFVEKISEHASSTSLELSRVQVQAVAAFAFGLACGSASCLQEQNSVLEVDDVNELFQQTAVNAPNILK